jgi:hypothetical protein
VIAPCASCDVTSSLLPHSFSISHHTYFIFVVLGFELRAYTLSHSTSPFFVMSFRAGGVAQVGECLPSKFRALGSSPNAGKINKRSFCERFYRDRVS